MKPRFREDYRLLIWMLLLMPSLCAVHLLVPALAIYLLPLSLYFAYCAGIASHNHNHCPVFRSRSINNAYAAWLSAFYGYPIFAWIPTHNQNHHKFLNGEGDDTRTTRHSQHNSLWSAVSYPVASIAYQSPTINRYLREAMQRRPSAMLAIVLQYATVIGIHTGYLITGVALHGWQTGTVVYALAMGLPSAFAIWSIMFTNYLQHVDCDPASGNNHSRNFVGQKTNWLLFNAGYHTVHHEHPGVHWSRYRALHDIRAASIDPVLNQSTLFAYCFTTYVRPLLTHRKPSAA